MADATTVIASGTSVSGHLEGAEDVLVLGAVRGSVRLSGSLVVEAEARVDATVEVTRLSVRGILVGQASASDYIELTGTARVVGDLAAPRIIVHEGAAVSGLLDTGNAVAETAGASLPTQSAPARPAAPATPARPGSTAATPTRPVAPAPAARPAPAPSAFPARPAAPAPVAPRPAAPAPVVAPRPAPVVTPPPVVHHEPTPPPAPVAPEPVPEPVVAESAPAEPEIEGPDDGEPDLPASAGRKQVAIKKRK